MATTVSFEGGQALAQTLGTLSARLRGLVLREVLTEAAEPMRETMGHLAPREPGAPDIADNMVISPLRTIEGERLLETEAAVGVGPAKGFFYGMFLEYGTVKMSARPFMRPAFDQHAPGTFEAIGKALWRELAAEGASAVSSVGGGPVSGGAGGSTL